MISGIAITLSLLLPLASPAAPEAAACSGADCADAAAVQLVESLKRPLPAHTAYTEVRFVQMLDAPLLLRGELDYPRADELGKTVTAPYQETTTIAAGQVVTTRPGKPAKKFSLKRAPALAGFLESFTATLAGDAARLAKSYTLRTQLSPQAGAHWQLELLPRDPALAKHVKRVLISGQAATPLCFEVEESSGDSSILLVDRLAAAPLDSTPQREHLQQLCRGTP
jgi:Outer membrane lipoprotein carrier protein LolA-like